MDELNYEVNNEYEKVIEEITQKFGYSENLKDILTKIIQCSLDNKSYEERQTFYKMLKTTPIVIVPENTKITPEELIEKMIGNINPHIKCLKEKEEINATNAFITQPVIDENLNLVGVKKFLYVSCFDVSKQLTEREQNFLDVFETGIDVPNLIYELGHAWASEKNPYTMKENNILIQRLGSCEKIYKINPLGNSKYELEPLSVDALYIEEGINTNFEEETLAKYLKISIDDVKNLYGKIIMSNPYQLSISSITEKLAGETLKKDIDKWRFSGDKEALENINLILSKANFYEKREKLYERDESIIEGSDENIVIARNKVFNDPEMSEETASILKELEKDFFVNPKEFSPIDMIDNVLLQYYNVNKQKYNLDVEKYTKILEIIAREGYGLINQALQNCA